MALNEGRGSTPATHGTDPGIGSPTVGRSTKAEAVPRLHLEGHGSLNTMMERSTKAEAVPRLHVLCATHYTQYLWKRSTKAEAVPRLHLCDAERCDQHVRRSTKAEAVPRLHRFDEVSSIIFHNPLNEGRGSTPATPLMIQNPRETLLSPRFGGSVNQFSL